ncbi:C-type lectin domain family 4 member M [Elysia marginata]|uniref:C-type lectin domain family 4 member M n=1 Tax=Elysia marginata TaxID=1093978 RepID=A0AAV4FFC1_9GAST|nr:C-type lectin domain family 4 member M [Elysia marginata]
MFVLVSEFLFIIFRYDLFSLSLFPLAIGTHCLQRQVHLTSATGQDCQTEQLGELWTSASQMTCYWQCVARYPDTCQSIIYNASTGTCTPGGVAFSPLEFFKSSIPAANSPDTIYYVEQPSPRCYDTFSLHKKCGFSLCLHIHTSSTASYAKARAQCDKIKSRLFVGNTIARLSLFWHATLESRRKVYWIGLTDLDHEGQFVWENGEILSKQQKQYIWHPGQPDNHGNDEYCAEARPKSNWNQGLCDNGCHNNKFYVCESYAQTS